jgi:alkanesulfonate monooxygenase SsuD/methylene tetrahydromethanopterin reductase-like flavin-dependent oxidoreductase (luciferase family)
MRRAVVGVPVLVAAALLPSAPAYAAGGSGDGGARLTAIFGLIGFVVLAAGMGVSAYRLSVARRRARAAGKSPNVATLRALSGEDDAEGEHDSSAQ